MSNLIMLFAFLLWSSTNLHQSGMDKTPLFSPEDQPVELGKVNWLRNFDQAVSRSQEEQKPIFILFQEVPGCSTCRNYGQQVLSHPLIVEAIESLFIPLAIYNNKEGSDKKVLRYYNEPAWNNPVVRIVDTQKENLIPRVNANYTALGLVEAMINALNTQLEPVPAYLQLLQEELSAAATGTQTAYFSMYCFWSGEQKLGNMKAVVETEAGFMKGKEVVKVRYNPAVSSFEEIAKKAKKLGCASHVFTTSQEQEQQAKVAVGSTAVSSQKSFRADGEPKFYLSKTHYKYVPMSPMQAARANSLIASLQIPDAVLSPKQIVLAQYIKANPNLKWPNAINADLPKAWEAATKLVEAMQP